MEELKKIAEQGMKDGWVKAFGEFGLDFDRLHYCGKEVQKKWFARQLEIAVEVCVISPPSISVPCRFHYVGRILPFPSNQHRSALNI